RPAARPADAGRRGHVLEAPAAVAVADVSKQPIAAHAGDENVRPAVVVVIADGHALAVHGDRQADPLGDVLEFAVALITVESKRRGRFCLVLVAGPVTGINEQKVLLTVLVEVDKGDAGAHRLW